MNKPIKRLLCGLLCASLSLPGALAATITPSVTSITLPKGETLASFDLILTADEAFAGAEFGLQPSADDITLSSLEMLGEIGGSNPVQADKNGIHYFGFFTGSNAYQPGTYKVAHLTYRYTGSAARTVTLASSKIVTIDEDSKQTEGDASSAPFTVTISRAGTTTEGGGSSGSGGGGGVSSGSAVSSTTNTVSVSTAPNGKVSLDKSSAKKGDMVTITVIPKNGYKLDKLTVTDSKGNAMTVTDKGNGKYTFTMPDSKVTVTPIFVAEQTSTEQPSDTKSFSDVKSSDWYNDAVQYVVDKGLMNGTGSNQFSPKVSTTRGMLMTVLARYAGEDTTGSNPWYQKGMDWAKSAGVSDGTNPTVNITREQLVTMLYRYASSPAVNGSLSAFSDAASVSSYAIPAMQWAVANGIVNGSNGKLNPKNNATRAEVAAILMRFCEMSK